MESLNILFFPRNVKILGTASYMDNYVAALFLPHTNMDLFPKLNVRLEARKAASSAP